MNPAQDTTKLSPMSMQRVTSIASFSLGPLALFVSIALVIITTALHRTIDTVARDTQSQAIASQLALNLLTYQRLSNLFILTRQSSVDEARGPLVSQMHQSLVLAESYAGSAGEHELLNRVAENLSDYLRDRQEVEARSPELQEAVTATTPNLDDVMESVGALQELNRVQVNQAQASAQRLKDVASMIGWIAAATLILGFLLIMLGIRRYVLRPILALYNAMTAFRAGDLTARSTAGGLREFTQLTQGFNEMADTLAQRRQEQLTYLAGVAHDLRNPLNGIKLGLYGLALEQSQEKRTRVYERLDRLVGRLTRMVEDLIDATRIEAGELELREENFDVRSVVEDMVLLYEPTSPNHQIAADQPPEPVMIHADPLRIEQVVSNLLSNAVKFSPDGGRITISLRAEKKEARLTISDQGIGISPDEKLNIFLPFRRLKQGVFPGCGLGLSVVRRIVEAHGGTIDVDSEPGVGTTFLIKLPLATQSGPGQAPTARS